MLKRYEIKVLLKAGHSRAEVAKLAGVWVRSVKRVAKEGDIEQVDDAAERIRRGIGRPSLVEDFRKPIVELLDQESDLKSVEVLRRMRPAGYTGQKTAELALHETRDGALAIPGSGQKRLEVVGDDTVKDGLFGAPRRVDAGRAFAGYGRLAR